MAYPQIFLLFLPFTILLFLQDLQETDAKNILDPRNNKDTQNRDQLEEVNIFFNITDLKPGKRLQIYFPVIKPSSKSPLLSREQADSIPFSSSQIPFLLQFFSFKTESPQARALEDALKQCEFDSIQGETKFCATSLESMLDSTRSLMGSNTKIKVLTTNHLTKTSSVYQNYTVTGQPEEIIANKTVGCHSLSYPYAVFYCHSQMSDNKLFKASLLGDDGGRIDAIAICHMDTSKWDLDHVAFRLLRTQPGKSPVCHFFPEDNLVWVAFGS